MAVESAWIAWKKYQHQIGYVVVGLLLFAAGWQTGRVTSPYYASHPIVFEEAANMPSGANTGSTEDLIALQEAGQQAKEGTAQVAAAATSLSAELADVSPTSSPLPSGGEVAAPQAEPRLFVGSKNSDLYHHKDCPSAARIKEENQVWWATREAAEAAGYTASQCTKEKLGNI